MKEKQPKDFDELLYLLEQQGYQIKRGKYVAVKGENQKRFIRFRSLGEGYRDDDLKKIIAGEMDAAYFDSENKDKTPDQPKQWKKPEREFDLLIDIQKKLAQGKGGAYKRFATNFNTKQVAKAVLFLKQHDVRDYAKLEKIVNDASGHFNELSAAIKEREKRMAEIQVLRTHIINYVKTKEVYASYRKSGYSKKFLEEHRQEILLHKAAKKAFDELGVKKLPKVKELNAEFAKLNAEKKQLFIEYRQAKKDMQDYQRAKYDIDQFLKEDEERNKSKNKHREISL